MTNPFILIVPELLVLALCSYKQPNYGPQTPQKEHFWLDLLKKAGALILIILISFNITRDDWRLQAIQDYALKVTAVLLVVGTLFFMAAIITDVKNPVNQYSLRRGFIKYSLQELSFFFLWAGVFFYCIQTPFPGQSSSALELRNYAMFIIALTSIQGASRKCGTFVFYVISAIHPPEHKPNSKEMKNIRKSNLK